MGLTLIHPLLLAGLAVCSLPIIIHLIGKRRAPTLYFAAFDFIMAVNKRLARREKLRQFLLLLLRTLALAALVVAIARPVPEQTVAAARENRRVGIILDTSASMSYAHGGATLFESAKAKARDALTALQPGDAVTLVAAGPEVRALLEAPTPDLARARAAIDALKPGSGIADLGGAMDAALGQFGSSPGPVSLVVVSDLSENSFRNVRPTRHDPPPDVRLIDAAEREEQAPLGNLAIESVTVEAGDGSASERRFKVVVHNFGSAKVSGRHLELLLNGTVTQRGLVDLPARSAQEKVYTHEFTGPGVFDGEVRLVADDADGYRVDDIMYFGVEVAPGVRVLAVDGDVRPTPHEDELFFAERALEAVPKGDAPIIVRIIGADELTATLESFDGFDVVLLANVGHIDELAVQRLTEFLRKGGGLFITLGDKVQFEEANRALAPLLPYALRDVHLAADPAAGTPPLGISGIDWDHPIMAGLGTPVSESLRASRTSRYFNLDVGAERKTRVILRFENGAPALIESRRADKGRVLLLTTSIDVDLTDLPLRSAYPAFLQRSVRYLADAVEGGTRVAVRQGGVAELAAPTGADAMALVSPSGARTVIALNGATRATFNALGEVGFWRAEAIAGGGGSRRVARLDVAVSPSLAESDFAPVRAEQVAGALAGEREGRAVEVAWGPKGDNDPFAVRGYGWIFLLALCFFFVSESLLSARG